MSLAVGVLGASGRMGRMVLEELLRPEVLDRGELRLAAAVARPGSASLGREAHALVGLSPRLPGDEVRLVAPGPGCFSGCDVVIDFSLPDALAAALPHLGKVALVSGTTGLPPETLQALDAQAQQAPVLWAANFSVGIALLVELVQQAAAAMPEADVEIVETHHRHKKDAPSGTANALADAVDAGRGGQAERSHGRVGQIGERAPGPIGMHALRGGDVVGEHTVWLLSQGERVWLGHQASSRATFAAGAVRAARWLAHRPPRRYLFREVLLP